MAVVIETTLGDVTVDLFLEQRPRTCLNFLKLCKLKYYNYNLFHTIQHDFIAQTGDPTGSGNGGTSVWGVAEGAHKRYFEAETQPKIRHSEPGLISMVSSGENMIGSQFFFTLGTDLISLDDKHVVFGEVVEGFDVLRQLNEVICDDKFRPYKDVRITHTVVLEDPFENPRGLRCPSRSPSPTAERLQGGRIAADEDIDDTNGKTDQEVNEMLQEQEAKARATILEIVGDLPDADIAPPENVLFVCKLNPVTSDDDLEIIFSRFGKIKGCEVIRDKQSGDSLQYAFVEFEEQKSCEDAYIKMDNVLIDDRRIHVDFSQSVSKIQWRGKGRGVVHLDGDKKGDRNGRQQQSGRRFDEKHRNDRSGADSRPRRLSSPQRRQEWANDRRNAPGSPARRNERISRRDERDRDNRSRQLARSRSRSPIRSSHHSADRRYDRRREDRVVDNNDNRRPRDRYQRRDSPPRRHQSPPGQRGRSPSHDQRRHAQPRSERRTDAEHPPKRVPTKRTESTSDGTSSGTESDTTSGDASERRHHHHKKATTKEKKQKRNKTKKSKKSRTSSDDDSSSSSESEDEQNRRQRRRHKKKSHKKHKKSK